MRRTLLALGLLCGTFAAAHADSYAVSNVSYQSTNDVLINTTANSGSFTGLAEPYLLNFSYSSNTNPQATDISIPISYTVTLTNAFGSQEVIDETTTLHFFYVDSNTVIDADPSTSTTVSTIESGAGLFNLLLDPTYGGVGQTGGHVYAGYLDNNIAPTPEPSSIALLGTGLVGMGGLLRKRFIK